jgi:hypothetical protein
MIQRGGSLCFALETRESLRIARHILWQKFQRDEAAKARILGLVDDTHSATAEFFDDAVVRDSLADGETGVRHVRQSLEGILSPYN